MSNEGEMLEIVNDLRDQYNIMKERLSRELAFKDEQIRFLEVEVRKVPELVFTNTQFNSTRPAANYPTYTDTIPNIKFYQCTRCKQTHPNQSICYY